MTTEDTTLREFSITSNSGTRTSQDFNKIRVDGKMLQNDVTFLTDYFDMRKKHFHRHGRPFFTKEDVVRALAENNVLKLRFFSEFFFRTSGIYSRLCRYMAYLYKYDYFITPISYDNKVKPEKVIEGWYKSSLLLDNCNLKKNFGEIALKVVKRGCYYGYKIDQKTSGYLQELPAEYCRSRFKWNGRYAVEFNIKYFDDRFADVEYRMRILKMFPVEFRKAYLSWKKGTLKKDFAGDEDGWFLLDPKKTVKFNIGNSDIPLFVAVLPAIMDLDDAQDLGQKKLAQQIMKIIVQQFPLDKNYDLVFDMDEMAALHQNAVSMLGDAIGVDVLSTVADVKVHDLSDDSDTTVDQLANAESAVYTEAGVSQMQFNTDGNIALEKSIANDEATMASLLYQFEEYAESLLEPYNKNPKRLMYRVQMLPTTIYNFKDLSKIYKEQTQVGFSKLLPQVALGQSQSSVIATAIFENDMMNLNEVFIPPQMSSTMSSKDNDEKTSQTSGNSTGGRPELPDDQKSTKTIQNKESEG